MWKKQKKTLFTNAQRNKPPQDNTYHNHRLRHNNPDPQLNFRITCKASYRQFYFTNASYR